MRIFLLCVGMFAALAIQPATAATPVAELQRLLDNAGYNTGGETGKWNDGTARALSAFASRYGMDAAPAAAPDDAAVTAILAVATAKIDAAYAAYPADAYFVGLGSQWYFNIHNWGQSALVNRDGKGTLVPVSRYFQPIEDDVAKFRAAGVTELVPVV